MTLSTVPVIFDLDGTLVDPAGGITGGISAALTQLGIRVPAPAQLDAMIGPKLSDSLLNIAGVPPEQLAEVIRIYRAYYLETGIAQSRLYPGIRELVEGYAASGRPIAVATQKPEGLAKIVLEHHGIAGSFRFIRGSAADEAAGATAPLGKTEIVAAALSDLRTQHAVMVGDRAQDVAGAMANGLDCIGVSWGFAPDGELHEAGAVAIVDSTRGLAVAIDNMDAVRTAAMSEVHDDGIV
ncbi:HAD hydrolase-like protein [Arthrobacter sp. ISL-69]|uniref:HAD hydrolase-like protein n=1 Tax=Arthrobacter sp. ISL-69 TaxID=2819113 RepID=UPI001BECA0D7|nr:HAD hydrolase-like protein [Arthrobacter sp. ISL-69]MBT2535588.1 HAD hydrolase-like protein [Arthrobacter sp. ISL-69]